MEETKKLSIDTVKSKMQNTYQLIWVDVRDNLDERHALIQKCLQEKSEVPLWEEIFTGYEEAELQALDEIFARLKVECLKEGFDYREVDEFFERHEDKIKELIRERDDSDLMGDLIRQTDDIPVRVEMLSNYDCINSHWLESSGYSYESSYFGDMIDALNLNPVKVKEIMESQGENLVGEFPDKMSRNGKELVSYEDFYQELLNTCCGANLLTYLAKINLQELRDNSFQLSEIIIPKGNICGIYSSIQGGGSLLAMELKEDLKLELKVENHHGFRLVLDSVNSPYSYSVSNVYGGGNSFFGSALKIIA